MINQTATLTFEQATKVTTNPYMLLVLGLVIILPLIFYIAIGCKVKGRSANGNVTSKSMIHYPNFWIAPLVWVLGQLFLLLFFVFPLWLKLF